MMTRSIACLAIVALLGACDESTAPVRPATLELSVTAPLAMFAGARDSIAATVIGTDGRPMTGVPIQWTTSNARIVEVQDGALIADSSGTARITARVDTLEAWVDVMVHQSLATLELAPADTILLLYGAVPLRPQALDATGRPMPLPNAPLTYSSSDSAVVAVDDTGLVRAVGWGVATITATVNGVSGSADVGSEPELVALGGIALERISVGRDHACGLDAQGAAYCWGQNGFGQTGQSVDAHSEQLLVPTALRFADIGAGERMTCGLTAAQEIWCWGTNSAGPLGQGPGSGVNRSAAPLMVIGGHQWLALGVGEHRAVCGVTTQQVVYCWGHNDAQQVGRAPASVADENVAPITGSFTARQVDLDQAGGCALSTDGQPICWGVHSLAQDRLPAIVGGGPALAVVTSGNDTGCGLTAGGEAHCWYGESGAPVWREAPGSQRFNTLTIALYTACGITEASHLYCWSVPRRPGDVIAPPRRFGPNDVTFQHVASSDVRFCALTSTSRIYCWSG